MRKSSFVIVMCFVLVVGACQAGLRAFGPPTAEEVVRDHFDAAVDEYDQRIAKRLRGGRFTSDTAAPTAAAVIEVAGDNVGVALLAVDDDGDANRVEVILLTHVSDSGAGYFDPYVDQDVSGCVRFTVSHGSAGWKSDDAYLTSRSVRCPDAAALPLWPAGSPWATSTTEGTASTILRIDGLRHRDYPIRPRPSVCYSGGGDCQKSGVTAPAVSVSGARGDASFEGDREGVEAGFQRMTQRALPLPVGSSDLVTR